MSLRFSKVNLECENVKTSFLVSGLPTSKADLENWTVFDNYVKELRNGTMVNANVETYLYGGEEIYDATPEEIAYFYKRIEMRPNFIVNSTTKLGESAFTFLI